MAYDYSKLLGRITEKFGTQARFSGAMGMSERRRHQVGKRGAIMAKFYFTYGTDGQPFFGGWTEVEAPDAHAACAAFRAYHPDKTEGLVNCSSIYDEEKFKLTGMYRESNFGFRCHEIITLRREAATN